MRSAAFLIGACLLSTVLKADDPERRAIAYLAREVPSWRPTHHCFSCHNNGDAAAALFLATGTKFAAPKEATRETLDFLQDPRRWAANGTDAAFDDKSLARLQFAAALASAVESGVLGDRRPLVEASSLLIADQAEDGSWPIDHAAAVGSPATYGPALATAIAARTIRQARDRRFDTPLARAEAWLRKLPIRNVSEASAVLLTAKPADDRTRIDRAIDLLRRAQNDDGGWGPFPRSPSEPFDTAVALIALASWHDIPGIDASRKRGRGYLVASMKDDGSWTETTRPTGAESYAERLSTAGWATRALLITAPK